MNVKEVAVLTYHYLYLLLYYKDLQEFIKFLGEIQFTQTPSHRSMQFSASALLNKIFSYPF